MRSVILLLSLLFANLANAGEALILICNKNVVDCTPETARIVFTIYVQPSIPTGCLISASQQFSASTADLVATDEIAKIVCGK
jgi:hypothetical protein